MNEQIINQISLIIKEINDMDPRFKKLIALNAKQASEIIGVSASTMENWRKEGIGPEWKKVNNGKRGRVLYPKVSIAEWIADTIKAA